MEQTIANSTNPKLSSGKTPLAAFAVGTVVLVGSVFAMIRTDVRTDAMIQNNPAIMAIEKQKEPYQRQIDLIQQRERSLIDATYGKDDIRTIIPFGEVGAVGFALALVGFLNRPKKET